MTEPASVQELFRGRHFDQEIIVLCVRWYLTFKLSSRDLVQMMAERGIALAHTTAMYTIPRVQPLVVQTSSLPSTLIPHGTLTAPSPL